MQLRTIKTQKRTRPTSWHLDRKSLVKKGVVNNQESPNSLSLPFQTPSRQASKRIGSLSNDEGDGNEKGKKNNRFILAKQQL